MKYNAHYYERYTTLCLIESTMNLFKKAKKESKVERFTKNAESGDVDSMLELGHIYMDGDDGIRKNRKKAEQWFLMAGNKKAGIAFFYLSEIYLEQIPDDATEHKYYELVINYYNNGIELNEFNCLNGLGHLYRLGHGVGQDYLKALEIFKKEASLGSANGMNEVANFYISGWGVKKDDTEATKWLKKAADLGHGNASMFLGAEPYCSIVKQIKT